MEVDGPGTQPHAAVRVGGRIAPIGVLAGCGGEVPTGALIGQQAPPQGLAARLKPVLDRSFPLENIADAFRRRESGAHVGRIVPGF